MSSLFAFCPPSEKVPEHFAPHSEAFARHVEEEALPAGDLIDLVFCMDCTGSMASYINTAKESIRSIVRTVAAAEKSDVRFGYVAYRDHPPQDSSFVTMCRDFMTDPSEMEAAIATFGADGGGDGPEAVTAGLKEALHFPWRERAARIVVLIADAPPHGIGANGDGFPQGDPTGTDPIDIANNMAEKGIILYVVACEPSLSGYRNAHDVMEGLAQITEGKYLPLTAASLLPDVIIGGAGEEAALKKLESFVDQKMEQMEQQNMSREEIEVRLGDMMKDVQTKQVEVTDLYGAYDRKNIEAVSKCKSLAEARENMVVLQQPAMQQQQQQMVSSSAKAVPVEKMMNRRCKKKGLF